MSKLDEPQIPEDASGLEVDTHASRIGIPTETSSVETLTPTMGQAWISPLSDPPLS